MNANTPDAIQGHRLLQLGMFLFLLGLLTGLTVPMLDNPRMGLSSHLEALMNGMLLILLGLLWPKLSLPRTPLTIAFWLAVYGTFANWLATLLAAIWGAGASMPIAAGDLKGSATQELVINVLLYSLTFAMIAVAVLVLLGLRSGNRNDARS